MEDQRRRTLDALEQRFAQVEVEVQSQQQKSKKWPAEDKKKVALLVETLSANSSVNMLLPKSSSRKANFSFQGHTSKEDVGVYEPAYLKLSHLFMKICYQMVSDGKIRVDRVLHELFQHGDSAQKYLKGSKSMKIENTILLNNYVQKSGSSSDGRIRTLHQGSKRSKKCLSLKRIGSFNLPKEFHKLQVFECSCWKEQLAQCFLNANLHGAVILVVRCKIVAHVGIHGIMVRETKETFGIVTQENKFKVVPKKYSVFAFQADCWKITLRGDRLLSRNLVP